MPGDRITGLYIGADEPVAYGVQRILAPERAVMLTFVLPDGSERRYVIPAEGAVSLAAALAKHGQIVIRKRKAAGQ
jgi:hypothetical protein